MASYTGTFSAANTQSNAVLLKPGQSVTYSLTESAPGTWSIVFQSSVNLQSWDTLATYIDDISATTVTNDSKIDYHYHLRCNSIAVVTVDYSIADATGEIQGEIKNPQSGVTEITFTDQGVTVNRNLTVTGTTAFTGGETHSGAQTFTGTVSVLDTFTIGGTTDSTKKVRFEPDGNTTSTTRVITVLDENMTMVGLASTQTLTNKTLTNPTLNAAAGVVVVPTSASPAQTTEGSVVWDSDDDLLTVGDGSSRKTMVDVGSTQSITGTKTLATPVLTNPVVNAGSGTIVLPASSSPAQTAEGSIVWDSDDDLLTVGDGSGRKTMVDLSSAQAVTGVKTMTTPVLTAATVTAQATDATIGAKADPASGTTAVTIAKLGNFFVLTFTLTAARIAVTDAGAAGAYGATKIFDFVEGGVSFLGCRQNYTAYTADGTGVPADDEFVIGIGTTNISAAADAVLAAANQNVGASIAQTLVAGTTTGTGYTAANSAFDGSGTAADLYLNYSGDDVTTDGNGTLDVTGTITVVGVLLGDD